MKKLLFASFFIIGSFNAKSQTTIDEYNYLTKGLEVSIENGLDIKSGYSLEKFNERKVADYHFDFYHFLKGDAKYPAAISIIAKSNVSGTTYFYCLPIDNNKLLALFYDKVNDLDESMTTALLVAMSELVTKYNKP